MKGDTARETSRPLRFVRASLLLLALALLPAAATEASVPRAAAPLREPIAFASLVASATAGGDFALGSDIEDLGAIDLAHAARTREGLFHPFPDLVRLGDEPLQGSPELGEDLRRELAFGDLKTRIGGSGLFFGTRIGAREPLSLDTQWGCGVWGWGQAEDQPQDPLGLEGEADNPGFWNKVIDWVRDSRFGRKLGWATGRIDEASGNAAKLERQIYEHGLGESTPIDPSNDELLRQSGYDPSQVRGALAGLQSGRRIKEDFRHETGDVVEAGGKEIARQGLYLGVAATARRAGGLVEQVPKPKEARATLGKATSKDYRSTFFKAYPEKKGKVVVHHGVEQQAARRFPTAVKPEEIHSFENLRGVPKELNPDMHLSKIRKAWSDFYRTNPSPTKEQLLEQATKLDSEFGHLFDPPVR